MARRIESYINTSVDDCRSSLSFVSDLEFLRELLARCLRLDLKTKAQVVSRRIKQVERNVGNDPKKQGGCHENN